VTTARAHPNIALVKYWGNRDESLRLPANGSISLSLDSLSVVCRVEFRAELDEDLVTINGQGADPSARERTTRHVDLIRARGALSLRAEVTSTANFPMGAGLASSAAAFAALTLAAATAAGLTLSPDELSRLARRGSGSACRSIFGGYVEWPSQGGDAESYAHQLASPEHWRLVDLIAVVGEQHKATGSTSGHALAATSPLQAARLADAARRLDLCRAAVLQRDFPALSAIVEQDSNLMHAVMLTSTPALQYWLPATLLVMEAVRRWRAEGLSVCYTVDAGPNVHCLCLPDAAPEVLRRLSAFPDVLRVLAAGPGPAAALVD
jgi:diphosphomevalonate decarboxylase